MNTIILIFIAGAGIILGVTLARQKRCNFVPGPLNYIRDKNKQSRRKEAGKEKILFTLMHSKEGRITNDEVEKMLKVSDTTAGRYLEELEKRGRIKQVGKTGRGVYYVLE